MAAFRFYDNDFRAQHLRGAFGGSVPSLIDNRRDAGAQAARLAGQAGRQISANLERQAAARDMAAASDALVRYQRDLAAHRDEYAARHQGRDALDAGTVFLDFADSLGKEYAARFSGPAGDLFRRQAAGIALHHGRQGQTYAERQETVWKKSAWEGELSSTLDSLAQTPGDAEYARFRLDGLKRTWAALHPGRDHRAAFDELERKGYGAMLDALLGDGDLDGAKSLLRDLDGPRPGSVELPADVTAMATEQARAQGVDPALALAVIARGSGGRQDAVSKAGARGLMQLMPDTAKELGVDPDDPKENVRGGVAYLKRMLERYKGRPEHALMAYNWGPGNVDAWLKTGRGLEGRPVPEETLAYVPAVPRRAARGTADASRRNPLGVDRDRYAAKIQVLEERAATLRAAQQATFLSENFRGDTVGAAAWIENNIKDPLERYRAQQAWMQRADMDDAVRKQMRDEALARGKKDIDTALQNAGGDLTRINAVIADAPPELKDYAAAWGKQAAGLDDKALSDPVALDAARREITADAPYDVVAVKYAGRLSSADMGKLQALAEDESRKEAGRMGDLYFDAAFTRSGYARLDGEERASAKAKLRLEYERRAAHVEDLDKKRGILFEIMADRSIPGMLFGRKNVTSLGASEKHPDGKDVRYAVPDAAREIIEKALRAKGLSVTDDTVEAAYINNRQHFGW